MTKNKKQPVGKSCRRVAGREIKNGPNLRVYRGKKVRKGKRLKRKRYPLQPLDIVTFCGKKYVVKGTHGYGRYVRLKSKTGDVFDK